MSVPEGLSSRQARRILITGGSGFIGSHLLPLLRSKGHVCLSTTDVAGDLDAESTLLRLPDESRCLEILGAFEPDVVLHLAGVSFVPDAEKDPLGATRVNVQGTLGLMNALRDHDPAGRVLVVFASTAQVYDSRQGGILTEESPLRPGNNYAATKLAAELVSGLCARADGRGAVVVRLFNSIGPGQRRDFVVSSFAYQVSRIERGASAPVLEVGNLSVARDFCDVRDIAAGLCLAAEGRVPSGTYNLASGTATPMTVVLDHLRRLSARPFEVRVRESLLRTGETASLSGDARKIHSCSGWKSTVPLEQSIRDILEWWRERRDD